MTPYTFHIYVADRESDDFDVYTRFFGIKNAKYVVRVHYDRKGINGETIRESHNKAKPLEK